jgi:hypothetical protein
MKGERVRSWRLMPVMRAERANADRAVARIAANQHGVVSKAQLHAVGVGHRSISHRVRACRLHRLHRGVYAVGHTRLSFEGRCMAAVLALGGEVCVSHQSAAALWGMLPTSDGPIHVTVPGDAGRRRRPGIAVHRSFTLNSRVTTRRHGIAVTRPGRILREIRRILPQPVFRRAVRRALDLRLISDSDLKGEPDLTRVSWSGPSSSSAYATAFQVRK